ncbi:MAG: exonuclease domain-containing protein [Desulfobacteraceae bacterium]|jgi:DNA polymerase III epsilon subunit-like protein|nr:exonuclease domain-containing protein [Desulfobacteraceae bacterium]
MFIFLDTETTGTGPEDRLRQIAFKPERGPGVCETFNPGRPVSIDAMSIHHITNRMVQSKPPFRGSDTHAQLQSLVRNEGNVIVAQKAQFDVDMLNREGIYPPLVICILKLARYLDKNGVIPKYNLQYLRYFLDLEIEATPHNALGEILVLEGVFSRINTKFQGNPELDDPVEEMIRISNGPILIARMPFDKHEGLLFSEVPPDYLEWLLTTELDEDVEFTVKKYLEGVSGE